MNKQQEVDMKLAYQAAAEITYMIAVGLSQAMENTKKEKLVTKRQKRVKSKESIKI
ncbi:MAG: hypothetical protein ACREPR_22865 [Brasilonema sp.]